MLLNYKELGSFSVSVLIHSALNYTLDVIFERDLLYSKKELLQNLKNQSFIGVRWVNIRPDEKVFLTKYIILVSVDLLYVLKEK